MGGNGSKGRGDLENPEKREYRTNVAFEITDNIKVIESKNSNAKVKLPEESHTPNRVYVAINKNTSVQFTNSDPFAGKLKSIAVYGDDCLKKFEIHVDHKHDGLQEHYHPWIEGKPQKAGKGKHSHNVAYPLRPEMKELLEFIKTKVPHV